MKTITLYKVVYFDAYNDMQERDFQELTDAQAFALTVQDARVFKYKLLGEIEEVI